jgi:acetoin utilization deacetylase AcuC-like enzyme
MKSVLAEAHSLHVPRVEFAGGTLRAACEIPERVDLILREMRAREFEEPKAAEPCGINTIRAVHGAGLIAFLQSIYPTWEAKYPGHHAIPETWCARGMRHKEPDALKGKLGYYCFDASTPIMDGTWSAALSSANAALTAAHIVMAGEAAAFAICRPPGHHAGTDFYGGYCYLNNAAIAARFLANRLGCRVAILDVDFHHGNGTQEIFYSSGDVVFISIHCDPTKAYPYFSGYADETGTGRGLGFNLNLPLPPGTGWLEYSAALERARAEVRRSQAAACVVSLGLDIYKHDPIGQFAIETQDFHELGRELAALSLPTVFVLEGGYAAEPLGRLVCDVLAGFESTTTSLGQTAQ